MLDELPISIDQFGVGILKVGGNKRMQIAPPYFPSGLFSEKGCDASMSAHVASVLWALHMGPLYLKEEKPPLRVYRFTWLRSFHPAIVIALSFGPNLPAHLAVRSLARDSMLPHIKHADSRDKILDDEAVETLVNAFKRVQFMHVPANVPLQGVSLDGAMWIIEAAEPGVYHGVYRRSPSDGPIRELGLEFLRIAGLEKEEVY